VARAKLDWWRSEVRGAFDGAPQHPVARALAPVVRAYDLPQSGLMEIIDGMQMDLDYNRYPDFATLESYCHRVAGVVGVLSAGIFGYTEPATLDYARTLGLALQLTNIIRDVGEDARRNRVYPPLDELSRFGLSAGSDRAARGRTLRTAHGAPDERAYYDRAPACCCGIAGSQRAGLVMAAIYRTLLRRRLLRGRTSRSASHDTDA
jgi:phytoene synthase